MGYAGYVPAKLPPAKLSAAQEALRQIKNPETLATIETLLRNVAVNQSQENTKRRVRLTNKTIERLIVNEKGGLEALKAFGWVSDPDDNDFIIVPKGNQISMSQVRMVQEAGAALKRDSRTVHRSTSAAKLPTTEEKARIREQMEADRLERASKKTKTQLEDVRTPLA